MPGNLGSNEEMQPISDVIILIGNEITSSPELHHHYRPAVLHTTPLFRIHGKEEEEEEEEEEQLQAH